MHDHHQIGRIGIVRMTALTAMHTATLTAVALAAPVDEDFTDGLAGTAPPARVETRLRAPEVAPRQEVLARTEMLEEELLYWQSRSADLNGDRVVDESDLAILLNGVGACPDAMPGCAGDFNRDGAIDDRDIAILLGRMGWTWSGDAHAEGARRIGYTAALPDALRAALGSVATPDGRTVLRAELHSEGAGGLRVQIKGLRRAGAEARIYLPGSDRILGPYTGERADDDDLWWSPLIDGASIGIELISELEDPSIPPPTIVATAHHYSEESCIECATAPGTPFSCHNCIGCSESWLNADARAVGQMSWISGTGCFWCSGALLNRGPGDQSPLFMTANHCISTQAEANTLEIRWLWETTTCNPCGGLTPFNEVNRNNGAHLLKRHTPSDWTLLGLWDPPDVPGGPFFAGWMSGSWSGTTATGVHHPAASHKRISFGSRTGDTSDYELCDQNGQNCFSVDVWDIEYTSGTTQGGSSGSPVFDADRRVRGTLSGGPVGCATITKHYGRLDLAYVNLRYFLGDSFVPVGAVYVNGSVSGDPGNNGSSERGTLLNPFNRLDEATYAVRSGDMIIMSGGNYTQSIRIWRPMTIEALGSGTVTITAP